MKYLLILYLMLSGCGQINTTEEAKDPIPAFQAEPALGFVSLAFDPIDEPNIAGYRLHWGEASSIYTQHKNIGKITENTLNDLTPGVPYYFTVTAYDANRLESDYSEEINYTFPVRSISWESAEYDPDIHNEAFSFSKDPDDGITYFYTHFQWEGHPKVKYRVFRKMDLNDVAWEEIETFNVYPSLSTPTVNRTLYMTYRYYPVPTSVFYKVSPIQR